MSRPIRAFLMVRDNVGEWQASVCRDLEAVEEIWNGLVRGETAVLHIGFDRPASIAFESLAALHPARLLLTAAAKFGLPPGTQVSAAPIGIVEQIPVHLVVHGWGYTIDDPEPSEVDDREGLFPTVEPRGWVSEFVDAHPDIAVEMSQAGIFDDHSFLANEAALEWETRRRSGLFRLKNLTEGHDWNPCIIAEASPPWFINRDLSTMTLPVRVENVFQRANIETVAELAETDFVDLLRMPNFGRKSGRDLRTALLDCLQKGPLQETGGSANAQRHSTAANPHSISETLLASLHGTLARRSPRERDVLSRRMGLNGSPETLDAISKDYGVTRERIRQIEAKAVKKIIKEEEWDDLLSAKLEKLLMGREFPLPVLGIEAVDEWFRDVSGNVPAFRYVLGYFCGGHVGVTTIDGVEYVGFLGQNDWDRSLAEARRTLQVGASQKWTEAHCKAVVSPILAENTKEFRSRLWDKATEGFHFAPGSDGSRVLIGQGRGVDSIIYAVLANSDRPLHFSELSECAEARAGRKIDAATARNAAASTAILLGRGLYGLDRHIALSEDEKDLVRQEAETMLMAGPVGRQWHTAEILAGLLEADVALACLDSYIIDYLLREVGSLRRLGRLTWVVGQSGTEKTSDRIDIRQAVVAFVEEAGRPLSHAEIKQRLVAVRGVSQSLQITPIPPLIRVGGGRLGLNDRDVPIKIADQPRLADQFVALLQSRNIGLHISEVDDEITMHWPQLAPRLLFSLAALDPRLRVSTSQYIYLQEWGDPRRETMYSTLEHVFAETGEPRTFDQIVERVTLTIGREPSKKRITACLQAIGTFDQSTGLWSLQSTPEEEE